MKKSMLGKIAVLITALIMVGACAKSGAVEIGDIAKDFSIQDVNGKAASLSDFKGKVIILNFFATWCPPCRTEIPDFIKLQNAHEQKGFTVIGVSTESAADVLGFVGANGMNYPVLIDSRSEAFNTYGPIRGIPTTFIIDKDFKVRKKYIGARSGEVFENDVKELL